MEQIFKKICICGKCQPTEEETAVQKKYLEYIRLDEIQKQIKWIKFALTIAERSHFKIVDNFNDSEKNE